ncbi:hypothetical protein LAZ67_17001905, partial [Cordylochernes scorpioides]
MAEGLNFLHKKRIVHRDIKPGNMLLSWDGHLKISDLEFAVKLEDIDYNYCQFGTSCYCSPEILLELGYYNTKIDMWALGIIVAMFYTKNEIFQSRSREEILEMICKMLGTKRVKSLDVNNEKFANIPEFTKPDWNVLDKVPKKALSFIKNLLEPDPKTRWSAEQCLKDDFLTDKRRKNPKFNHIPNKYGTSRNTWGYPPVHRGGPGVDSSPRHSTLEKLANIVVLCCKKQYHTQYIILNMRMEEALLRESASEDIFTAEYESVCEYEDNFSNIMTDYEALAEKDDVSTISGTAAMNYQLPKLEFKKFGGEPREWITFWSQFSTIDRDPQMPPETKFQYLFQATAENSEVREAVESFPPSADNYPKVIEYIKSRFGEDEMLVEIYVRDLLQNVRAEGKMSVVKLYNRLETQLRALETLGVARDKCAAMLYPLVESALPEDTLRVWERSQYTVSGRGVQDKLTQLMTFLKTEVKGESRVNMAKAAFKIDNNQDAKDDRSNRKSLSKKNTGSKMPTATDLANTTQMRNNRIFCGNGHPSQECYSGQRMHLPEKKDKAKGKNFRRSGFMEIRLLGIMDAAETKSWKDLIEASNTHFKETVKRDESGRYIVSLPWIAGHPPVPVNRRTTENRLLTTTRNVQGKMLYEKYDTIFEEWEKERFIEEVEDKWEECSYLPHRPVLKDSHTTPISPVFDASCKKKGLPSLNQCLEKGDNLIELIPDLLLRFRLGNYGIIANIRKAFLQIQESSDIMMQAKFELRDWMWNEPGITEQDPASILGMKWHLQTDTIAINVQSLKNIDEEKSITKRSILSACHRIFDPIQFTCPATIKIKKMVQDAWKENKSWDEPLNEDRRVEFIKWRKQALELDQIKIPRWILPIKGRTTLHVFSDASAIAYATVIFMRIENASVIVVRFVKARNRLATIKRITIPRLELLACLIGARLLVHVLENLEESPEKIQCWTDSSPALYNNKRIGLSSFPTVSRRSQYLRRVKIGTMSQGNTIQQISHPVYDLEAIEEERRKTVVTGFVAKKPEENSWYLNLYEGKREVTLTQILRVIAWMLRFKPSEYKGDIISQEELDSAEKSLDKIIQSESIGEKDPKMKQLHAFQDKEGLWRVKTRIVNRNDDELFRLPILIPTNHPVTELIVKSVHEKMYHCGAQTLRSVLREKFWIPKARQLFRHVIHKCPRCRRFETKRVDVPEASLPQHRVRDVVVFEVTGIDLGGPLYLEDGQKVWFVIFTCGVYRAVHLELVTSLSTEALVGAVERFVARRGCPAVIYSDNGTNLVGLRNELYRVNFLVKWKLNPPGAPWWGGWIERIVGLTKKLLRRLLGKRVVNYEEMVTILENCERVINARPLTYIAEDNDDLVPLTPEMFLREPRAEGEIDLNEFRCNFGKSYEKRKRLLKEFLKRFRSEYLGLLVHHDNRKKQRQLKVGDIVLVEVENRKQINWPMGKITKVFPGTDNVRRLVEVKTKSGFMKRAVQRLFPLEVPSEDVEQGNGELKPAEDEIVREKTSGVESASVQEKTTPVKQQSLFDRMKEVLKIPLEMDFDSYADADNDVVTNAMLSDVEIVESILQAKEEEETDQVDEEVDPIVHIPHPKEVLESIQTLRLFLQCQDESKSLYRHLNTITRTTNEIKSGLSLKEVDIILIRAKFERLTILNDRLILIDDKIKEILLDDPRSTEAQINDEMELCETYSLQVGIVAQKVKEYESKLAAPCDDKMSQSSTSDVKRQIKLPNFELKKYTGELEEWLSWWSHFEKIHLEESLSDVDKFEYLIQSMVVGSKAHRLVTSFPLTQKNYNKVIGDLKDRFGDRDMLTELYVRKLLKLVIASARSEKRTLAQLYDDLVAHLHSLGSLGVDTKSGGGAFLYPLVESSLPLELIKIWQRSRTPYIEAGIEHSGTKAFDKLEGLIEFLKQEVKNAERISFVAEGFEPSLPLKQGKRENNPPKIHTASALFVGKTNLPCLFCDKENHLSQNCFKAAKMLESDRLKRVQDAKVCFKCLRKNHLKKDCRSFVRCKHCQGPHFEIMCRGTSHSQENLNWRSDNRSHNSLAEQNEGNSEPVTAMANQVCTNNISLMTLIVKIKGPKRSKMVRVLLDSGSQKSYIRRSLAKELDLPKVGEVKLNKFLFGGQTTGEKAHSIFYFQLDNVDEGKAFKMEALEETIICGNISPIESGPRQWELDKKGITLTKVDNNKTEIDILIGGDYFGQLLTGKIEQLAGGLTAIQTVLGWTLIGNTSSERPETSAQMVITLLTTQKRVASLWELETIGIRDPTEVISVKEKNVLMQEKFREKICRGHDGRYLVSLPWKEGIGTIPNNLEIAKRRLEAMTQKLTQKGQFVPYDEVFRSWFRENLIEEVDGEDIKPTGHYLPHRPIYKVQSETTPIRPVYDASCKASKRSLSLNECLETGPNLIELLPEILIRFRKKKIGAIADIRKAFQTVGIDEKERFHKEYLAMLVQKRNETEGRRFLPGEVVLIGRDDQERIFWPLGRILELYPGKDGRERVARVRTATGEFVRPLKRLFSLELGSDISREVRLPKTEGIKAQEIPTDGEQLIFTRSGKEVKKNLRDW